MKNNSYSNQIYIKSSPSLVFSALTEGINKWWTETSNQISKAGDKLVVQFEESTKWEMDVTVFNPHSSIEWHVTRAHHNLEQLHKKDEWENTIIKWKIEKFENGAKVYLIHEGLMSNLECYEICKAGWNYFLDSLKNFLETLKGNPYLSFEKS